MNPSNVNSQADLCKERCIKPAVRMTNHDSGIKRSLAHKGFTESNCRSVYLSVMSGRESAGQACRCVQSVYVGVVEVSTSAMLKVKNHRR